MIKKVARKFRVKLLYKTLAEYLIKTYSNEEDTVLDNTFGSGFTGIAAIKTKRKFIGIEQSEENDGCYNIGKSRILKEK